MKIPAIAFAVGVIFSLGLCISEMIDPMRVIGFLDVAGAWDATLLLVMGGAVTVTGIGFPLVLKRLKPICADSFNLPVNTRIDPRLIAGSALFGIGWGLAGFCPGPAIAALSTLSLPVLSFVVAMIAGQWLAKLTAG